MASVGLQAEQRLIEAEQQETDRPEELVRRIDYHAHPSELRALVDEREVVAQEGVVEDHRVGRHPEGEESQGENGGSTEPDASLGASLGHPGFFSFECSRTSRGGPALARPRAYISCLLEATRQG